MNKLRFVPGPVLAVFCLLMFVAQAHPADSREPFYVDAQLVWGTNDPMSPDPNHKPVDPKLEKILRNGPYRWKYYYQVNRVVVTLASGETRKGVKMSSKCVLDMTNPGDGRVEVILHGDGKKVSKHAEPFPKDKHFILGGNAQNETAWFVVLTRIDSPPKADKPVAK